MRSDICSIYPASKIASTFIFFRFFLIFSTISGLATPSIYITATSVLLLLPILLLTTFKFVSRIRLRIRTTLLLTDSAKASLGPCTTTSFSAVGTPLVGHPFVDATKALSFPSANITVSPKRIDVNKFSKSFSSLISPMLMASSISLSNIFISDVTLVLFIRFVIIEFSITSVLTMLSI